MKYIKITTLWETMGNTMRICNAAVSYEKAKLEWMFVSSKTQKNTAVAQPREVIDVESSSYFSFGVEPIVNTSLKENQSKAGMQVEYTDRNKGVNIQAQQQNYNEQNGKEQHSGMQADYNVRNGGANIL